jgi:glutamine synthetase
VLNTIVAEAIDYLAEELDGAISGGKTLEEALPPIIQRSYAANKQIVFDGDGYSDEWHTEAATRGLLNLRSTPDALPYLINDETVTVFSNYAVLSERELHSRYEVFAEQYVTKINIESETAASIARTMILPAAARHLAVLLSAQLPELASETEELIGTLVEAIKNLESANLAENQPEDDVLTHGKYMHDTVLPAMGEVRAAADQLERIVADDLWPLPKYSEILFIK